MPTKNISNALIELLTEGSWEQIAQTHQDVGLDWRDDLKPGWGKPKYVERVLRELAPAEILVLAQRCLKYFPEHNTKDLQDALWHHEANDTLKLSIITRQKLADELDGKRLDPQNLPDHFLLQFSKQSKQLGYIEYDDSNNLVGTNFSANFHILSGTHAQHSQSTRKFSHREVLSSYGFFDWPDKRVFQFLERLVHPEVRQGSEQQEWLELLNETLRQDRLELAEHARVSNHPTFTVIELHQGVNGRPKNLLFASTGPKPEIGFTDAVNNDIKILRNEEHCLLYDRPLTDDGLLWEELVDWWADRQGISSVDETVRNEFGNRLMKSLGSKPEANFFAEYFRLFRKDLNERLPALLPQVYLHYDPVTIKHLQDRNEEKRFKIQRMDFLMLLPGRRRLIFEIDGKQHYSTEENGNWLASPQTYAETTSSDRMLRLAGYEVYRFGGYELSEPDRAHGVVEEFFTTLFRGAKILANE